MGAQEGGLSHLVPRQQPYGYEGDAIKCAWSVPHRGRALYLKMLSNFRSSWLIEVAILGVGSASSCRRCLSSTLEEGQRLCLPVPSAIE